MNAKINVIHAPDGRNPFAVIEKPSGIASAPLSGGEIDTAYAQCAALFPELNRVQGRNVLEHGLVHRIDTATHGLLIIASTQESYDSLMQSQRAGLFEKSYFAECVRIPCAVPGFPPFPGPSAGTAAGAVFTITSFFRPYGTGRKEVRPVIESAGRYAVKKGGSCLYRTSVTVCTSSEKRVTVSCTLTAGYRHQVRCHLAWAGLPIIGDTLYNPQCGDEPFCFTAYRLVFPHPLTAEKIVFELPIDQKSKNQ